MLRDSTRVPDVHRRGKIRYGANPCPVHDRELTWIGFTIHRRTVSGLYLLKRISISLVWINTGHMMCSWTHLDPSFITNTAKNSLELAVTKAWQLWDSCVPVL
jgi:hypothetical protein